MSIQKNANNANEATELTEGQQALLDSRNTPSYLPYTRLVGLISGISKAGKTTCISGLTHFFKEFAKLGKSDDGRTKFPVIYLLFPYTEEATVSVAEINIYLKNLTGTPDGSDVEKYNANYEKNKALYKLLGLSPLPLDGNPKKHVEEAISTLKNSPVDFNQLGKLISTEGMDLYIQNLTLKAPANEMLSTFLEANHLELELRDTRGWGDLIVGNEEEVKRQTSKSLSDLSMDGGDFVIFFAESSYNNSISSLYKDTIYNIHSAIPVFMLSNKSDLMASLKRNWLTAIKQGATAKEAMFALLNAVTSGEDFYSYEEPVISPSILQGMFYAAYKLFEKVGLGQFQEDEFMFESNYFSKESLQFILPSCESMRSNQFDLEKEDVVYWQTVLTVSLMNMVTQTLSLKKDQTELETFETLKKILKPENDFFNKAVDSVIAIIEDDTKKYGFASQGIHAPLLMRPNLKGHTMYSIQEDLTDVNYNPLGTYGGITTMNNGKMRYGSTVVTAVTSLHALRDWLYALLTLLEEYTPNPDDSNPLKLSEAKLQLLKQTINHAIYHKLIDNNATVRGYNIIDRHIVVDEMEKNREINPNSNPFATLIDGILKESSTYFIEEAKETDEVEEAEEVEETPQTLEVESQEACDMTNFEKEAFYVDFDEEDKDCDIDPNWNPDENFELEVLMLNAEDDMYNKTFLSEFVDLIHFLSELTEGMIPWYPSTGVTLEAYLDEKAPFYQNHTIHNILKSYPHLTSAISSPYYHHEHPEPLADGFLTIKGVFSGFVRENYRVTDQVGLLMLKQQVLQCKQKLICFLFAHFEMYRTDKVFCCVADYCKERNLPVLEFYKSLTDALPPRQDNATLDDLLVETTFQGIYPNAWRFCQDYDIDLSPEDMSIHIINEDIEEDVLDDLKLCTDEDTYDFEYEEISCIPFECIFWTSLEDNQGLI